MFSSRAQSHAPATSSSASSPALSEIRSTRTRRRMSPQGVRELVVTNLNDIDGNFRPYTLPTQREPYPIPRPIVRVSSSPSIPNEPIARRPPPELRPYPSAFNAPVPVRPIPVQYQYRPISYQRLSPRAMFHRVKDKHYVQEKPPGICATFCSGGCGAFAVSMYLLIVLALPTTKLVLGVVYRDECPLNRNIPLYMIVSGSAGIAIVLFLLLSSSCTYCRSSIKARKITHGLMIGTIGFARGMQVLLAIFLFVWFFFGNAWVFGVRDRLQTTRTMSGNYCHPVLYWTAFYILIFTYVATVAICLVKFCAQFCFCGACSLWKGAFS